MRFIRFAGFLVLFTIVAGACDDDPLDPDVTGLVNTVVHDDPLQGAGKRSASFTGTAAGNMHVSLRSTGGAWIDIGSPNGITVNLQNQTGATVHGTTSVPAGTFDRVRLTLSDVEVTLKAGGVIGPISLQSDVKATVGENSPVIVERSVSEFVVGDAGTALVEFDLNVENWLDEEALDTGAISRSVVQGSVEAEAGY